MLNTPNYSPPPSLKTTVVSHRSERRTGVYLSVMGDPYPTLAGLNLAINVFDFLRLTGGIGAVGARFGSLGGDRGVASATTYGAGLRAFLPGWSFSPVIGISFARVEIARQAPGKINVQGFEATGEHWYGTIGLDWQGRDGFNLGAGCSVSARESIGALPYINMGWFFPVI